MASSDPSSPPVSPMTSPQRRGGSSLSRVTGADSVRTPLQSYPSTPARGALSLTPQATPGRTPVRSRRDLGTPFSMPMTALPSTSPAVRSRRRMVSSSTRSAASDVPEEGGSKLVIYGTSINMEDALRKAQLFFRTYTQGGSDGPHYLSVFQDMHHSQEFSVSLDCSHVYDFDRELYGQLVRYPEEMVAIFDLAAHEVYQALYPSDIEEERHLVVRTFNLMKSHSLRELYPEDLEHLICIKGMITRTSAIIPDLRMAHFACQVCGFTVENEVDRTYVVHPDQCPSCNKRGTFDVIHNRSKFVDKQLVRLQEAPDDIPEGETPATLTLYLYEDLVELIKPGDRVEVVGIYRAGEIRVNSFTRNQRAIFRTYLDAIHVKRASSSRVGAEEEGDKQGEQHGELHEDNQLRSDVEERTRQLRALAQQGDIYETLIDSLAPSIYELADVKKGLLCQLLGGSNKTLKARSGNSATARLRGEINVLLCGDPGTSKSQLLQYVHKIAPRGIYTSGKGSSAVGLTAYVTKDPETKEFVLESGALVLSDRGICCIDEFDKMSDYTRTVLHEAMEQQTLSVAKAGIVCSLNARTSILAAANPRESRYNPGKSVVENIDLPPTLLSRFDLIYLVLDRADPTSDRRLAEHLVSLYFQNPKVQRHEMDMKTLTDYISYARAHINPTLSSDAQAALVNAYVSMRKIGSASSTVTSTPRQLESLIRLAEANAKMRLAETVERSDVNEAVRLVKEALLTAATDPRTGRIDVHQLSAGVTLSKQRMISEIAEAAFETIRRVKSFNTVSDFREATQARLGNEIERADFLEATQELVQGQSVRRERDGKFRFVGGH